MNCEELYELHALVKSELPHLKYAIDTLHAQGLSSGALTEI